MIDFRDLISRYKDGETKIVRYLIMAGVIVVVVLFAVVIFYTLPGTRSSTPTPVTAPTEFALRSIAFNDGKPMPPVYAGDDENRSPPLDFLNVPAGAAALALTLTETHDDESPPTVHWLIYRIAPDAGGLAEGIEPVGRPDYPVGARQGAVSLGAVSPGAALTGADARGYHGPAPAPGTGRHRYTFTLYVLREKLEDAKPGLTHDELLALMEGKVMAQTTFVGTLKR